MKTVITMKYVSAILFIALALLLIAGEQSVEASFSSVMGKIGHYGSAVVNGLDKIAPIVSAGIKIAGMFD